MNSNFSVEQIKAYASAFETGDAIWCNGKWYEVEWYEVVENKKNGNNKLTAYADGNIFVINDGQDGECQSGTPYGFWIGGCNENPYRVTTLTDYKLQGGEKLVWLGGNGSIFTFGEVYEVKHRPESEVNIFIYDNEDYVRIPKSENWAVIPSYEQVQSIEQKEVKTSDIANILYKRYYDVLQSALHNNIKSALQENNYSLVIELSELAIEMEESK